MNYGLPAPVLLAVLPIHCQSQSSSDESNRIISYVNEVNVDNYKFAYESGDGTFREETGGFEDGIWTVRGRVSWTSPKGTFFSYSYIADGNGYRQTAVGTPLSASAVVPGDEDDDGFVSYALPTKAVKGLLGGANR
ncbi:hypothetical protein LSTR_LSTR002261 [Laodelphax striatellus]|uniref:Uncharacterized protein n=1 Tax=Laodelphax striatellus TaxID=195883 RepID=A0A482XGP9_LAOST|nr:hypothetical protein LSTR_LSTR002261 [Laodelphax striatellus]